MNMIGVFKELPNFGDEDKVTDYLILLEVNSFGFPF